MTDLHDLLVLAKEAALKAGQEILRVYEADDFGIEHKSDQSPLTRADKAAHHTIIDLLNKTDYPVLSEEGAEVLYTERKSWSRFWMIDPLDGTKEFIKRNGEFTVNIAIIDNGVPILGVVYVPVQKKLYYSAENLGAFLEFNGATESLHLSKKQDLENLRVVASRSHLNDETKDFIQKLHKPQIVSMGSSLKFLCIANGQAEVYPRFAPTMEWDSAAADAICREMGLIVQNIDTLEPLQYNKENLLNPFFVVANQNILELLKLS